MSDDFDDAVQDVNTGKKGGEETASVFYEKREYPLLPEGIYMAICIDAKVKDANPNGQYYKAGDKNIYLTWEIRQPGLYMLNKDKTVMKDKDDKPMTFRVFSRQLPVGFGPRTNLRKLFLKLTGYDLAIKNNPLVKRVPVKKMIDMGGGKMVEKEGWEIVFDHKTFLYMEANLDIEHNSWEDKNSGETRVSAQPVNYKVTPEMKKKNYEMLPPEARGQQQMSTEEIELDSAQSQQEQQVEANASAKNAIRDHQKEQEAKMADPGLKDFLEKTA